VFKALDERLRRELGLLPATEAATV
jgi:hypothetical protein